MEHRPERILLDRPEQARLEHHEREEVVLPDHQKLEVVPDHPEVAEQPEVVLVHHAAAALAELDQDHPEVVVPAEAVLDRAVAELAEVVPAPEVVERVEVAQEVLREVAADLLPDQEETKSNHSI